jgi:hypothetical protein
MLTLFGFDWGKRLFFALQGIVDLEHAAENSKGAAAR